MRKALLAALVCAALAIGCSDAADPQSVALETGNMTSAAKIDDVRCKSDDGGAYATGTVENISASTWAFQIVVEWHGRDGKFYTGAQFETGDIAPGDRGTWEARPNTPEALMGTCEVVDVVKLMPGLATTTVAVPPDGN